MDTPRTSGSPWPRRAEAQLSGAGLVDTVEDFSELLPALRFLRFGFCRCRWVLFGVGETAFGGFNGKSKSRARSPKQRLPNKKSVLPRWIQPLLCHDTVHGIPRRCPELQQNRNLGGSLCCNGPAAGIWWTVLANTSLKRPVW